MPLRHRILVNYFRIFLINQQLQEEKKRLKEENAEAAAEIPALREEINALRERLEETEWKLCQKSGELTHIKSQLEESQVITSISART